MPTVNPDVLSWARQTAGLSPDDAVKKLQLRDARGVAAVDRLHGHLVEVVFRVALYLPAVGVEGLAEIALAVEQTNPDEGNA